MNLVQRGQSVRVARNCSKNCLGMAILSSQKPDFTLESRHALAINIQNVTRPSLEKERKTQENQFWLEKCENFAVKTINKAVRGKQIQKKETNFFFLCLANLQTANWFFSKTGTLAAEVSEQKSKHTWQVLASFCCFIFWFEKHFALQKHWLVTNYEHN